MKRRVVSGIKFDDHFSCDLECGHVIVVQGKRRPALNQECRFCVHEAAIKAAK